ncbi:MAG: 50S ribosomal protein L22 [Elusimicrobiota bacterium]|jgi:large subunit ribosomal protein L22|nr:50S ribosomal protein L22 [Elusimicrobiota bacterium]
MEAKATAKFIRNTPRKTNQVLSIIRGKKISKAMEALAFSPKSAAIVVGKVLNSAIANAGAIGNVENFVVKEAWVGNGSILKRMITGPKGRGMPIKKRTAHVTIVISNENIKNKK